MSDTTNIIATQTRIEMMLGALNACRAPEYHQETLIALVAERDALRKQLAAMRLSDDCEMTALECKVRCKALSAERDELKRQVAEAWRLYCVEVSRRQDSELRNFKPEWGAEYLGRDCFPQNEGGGA